jgi:hypothetical protein
MGEGWAARPQGHAVILTRQATVFDIEVLVPLFDGYRRFYRQPSEPDRIRRFLLERFEHNQSVIFVAIRNGTSIGFHATLSKLFVSGVGEDLHSE